MLVQSFSAMDIADSKPFMMKTIWSIVLSRPCTFYDLSVIAKSSSRTISLRFVNPENEDAKVSVDPTKKLNVPFLTQYLGGFYIERNSETIIELENDWETINNSLEDHLFLIASFQSSTDIPIDIILPLYETPLRSDENASKSIEYKPSAVHPITQSLSSYNPHRSPLGTLSENVQVFQPPTVSSPRDSLSFPKLVTIASFAPVTAQPSIDKETSMNSMVENAPTSANSESKLDILLRAIEAESENAPPTTVMLPKVKSGLKAHVGPSVSSFSLSKRSTLPLMVAPASIAENATSLAPTMLVPRSLSLPPMSLISNSANVETLHPNEQSSHPAPPVRRKSFLSSHIGPTLGPRRSSVSSVAPVSTSIQEIVLPKSTSVPKSIAIRNPVIHQYISQPFRPLDRLITPNIDPEIDLQRESAVLKCILQRLLSTSTSSSSSKRPSSDISPSASSVVSIARSYGEARSAFESSVFSSARKAVELEVSRPVARISLPKGTVVHKDAPLQSLVMELLLTSYNLVWLHLGATTLLSASSSSSLSPPTSISTQTVVSSKNLIRSHSSFMMVNHRQHLGTQLAVKRARKPYAFAFVNGTEASRMKAAAIAIERRLKQQKMSKNGLRVTPSAVTTSSTKSVPTSTSSFEVSLSATKKLLFELLFVDKSMTLQQAIKSGEIVRKRRQSISGEVKPRRMSISSTSTPSTSSVDSSPMLQVAEQMVNQRGNARFLTNFLTLVMFLDHLVSSETSLSSEFSSVPLFCVQKSTSSAASSKKQTPKSVHSIKSTASLLNAFAKVALNGVGGVTSSSSLTIVRSSSKHDIHSKLIAISGLPLQYSQLPIHELDWELNSLETDLKDGTKIIRLLELLQETPAYLLLTQAVKRSDTSPRPGTHSSSAPPLSAKKMTKQGKQPLVKEAPMLLRFPVIVTRTTLLHNTSVALSLMNNCYKTTIDQSKEDRPLQSLLNLSSRDIVAGSIPKITTLLFFMLHECQKNPSHPVEPRLRPNTSLLHLEVTRLSKYALVSSSDSRSKLSPGAITAWPFTNSESFALLSWIHCFTPKNSIYSSMFHSSPLIFLSDGVMIASLISHYAPKLCPQASIRRKTLVSMQPYHGSNSHIVIPSSLSMSAVSTALKSETANWTLVSSTCQALSIPVPPQTLTSINSMQLASSRFVLLFLSILSHHLLGEPLKVRASNVMKHAWKEYKNRKNRAFNDRLSPIKQSIALRRISRWVQRVVKPNLPHLREARCARVILSAWRCYKAKSLLKKLRIARDAVVTSKRNDFAAKLRQRRDHRRAAATYIGARVRGWLIRRAIAKQVRAAVSIQALWRGSRERRRKGKFSRSANAVRKLQAWWRRISGARKFHALKNAVKTIQLAFRKTLEARATLLSSQLKASATIKTWWRIVHSKSFARTARTGASSSSVFSSSIHRKCQPSQLILSPHSIVSHSHTVCGSTVSSASSIFSKLSTRSLLRGLKQFEMENGLGTIEEECNGSTNRLLSPTSTLSTCYPSPALSVTSSTLFFERKQSPMVHVSPSFQASLMSSSSSSKVPHHSLIRQDSLYVPTVPLFVVKKHGPVICRFLRFAFDRIKYLRTRQCVLLLQSFARMWKARNKFNIMKGSCVLIQKMWRGYKCRAALGSELASKLQVGETRRIHAAITIQRIWRGHIDRSYVTKLMQAMILLQKCWRRSNLRTRLLKKLQPTFPSSVVQGNNPTTDGNVGGVAFGSKKRSLVTLPVRGFSNPTNSMVSRAPFVSRRDLAATVISKTWKSVACRLRFVIFRAAVITLQAHWRGIRCRRGLVNVSSKQFFRPNMSTDFSMISSISALSLQPVLSSNNGHSLKQPLSTRNLLVDRRNGNLQSFVSSTKESHPPMDASRNTFQYVNTSVSTIMNSNKIKQLIRAYSIIQQSKLGKMHQASLLDRHFSIFTACSPMKKGHQLLLLKVTQQLAFLIEDGIWKPENEASQKQLEGMIQATFKWSNQGSIIFRPVLQLLIKATSIMHKQSLVEFFESKPEMKRTILQAQKSYAAYVSSQATFEMEDALLQATFTSFLRHSGILVV
jgi:IQ calmodulin-binding motif